MVSQPFSRILSAQIDGRAQNARYRQNQFHRLQSTLVQHVEDIKQAIQCDSGHASEEIQAEISLALKEIRTHYLSVNLDKDLEREYRVAHGKDNVDGKRGVGIVYIVPTRHTMFYSVISALSAAIAAGSCVIVELTRNTMAVPALLRKLLPEALDADTFAVSEERPTDAFLSKVILVLQQEQSSNVPALCSLASPVTSRTVAVVDRSTNVAEAARQLVAARFAFGGLSTYSPDAVLVHEFAMKPFFEAVIQQSSIHLAGQNGEARQTVTATQKGRPSLLDIAQKDSGARVLVSGSNWGVVEVHDRRSSLLQMKVDEKVLLVHPITSLDDAINFTNNGTGTLAATYVFAAPSSAKYLSESIDAYVSWINHVPENMLIGPAYPANTSPTTETRYSTDLFQVPRAQLVSQTPASALVHNFLDTKTTRKALAAWNEALAPLPPTKQKPGRRLGFFEQGIVTGGVVTLLSLVTLGFYGFTYVRRL